MQMPDFLHHADGEIRLIGHRIRLVEVAMRYDEGLSPEEIAFVEYPSLDLPLVQKTVAFYLENRDEVRLLIDEHIKTVERLMAETKPGPTPAELRRRLRAKQREAS